MTASKIIDKAILLLGYDTLKNTGSISGFEHAALTALNIVYADIFYLYNFKGFKEITDVSQPVDLNEKAIFDVMPYGVAAFLASSQGDSDNQQFFSQIYNLKRKNLISGGAVEDSIPVV
jgi:hypothetical protein